MAIKDENEIVTRVEFIFPMPIGRVIARRTGKNVWRTEDGSELQIQDEGRTIKVFPKNAIK